MYDDLLGSKEKKKKALTDEQKSSIVSIGFCGQCLHAARSKVHRRSTNLYCPKIKKYVHTNSMGCLKFERINGKIISSFDI